MISRPHPAGAQWDADRKAWIIIPGTMAERARQQSAVFALKKSGVIVTEEDRQ